MKKWLLFLITFNFIVGCSSSDDSKTSPEVPDNKSIPTVTTKSVTDITTNTAVTGGIVTANGSSVPTETGICWSKNPSPTVSLTTKTQEGGNLNFTSTIANLEPGTTYYVRAYATNSSGTGYGNQMTFTTNPTPIVAEDFTNLNAAIISKMQQYAIPSVSIAIIKNEKLVYLQAHGTSDIESNTAASNNDLYRIASISKPLTAVAILKLVQDGHITLNQKVFGPNGILGYDYGILPENSNKHNITIKHLLDHKSGWTNNPFDPMFTANFYTHFDIISELYLNRELEYAPGTTEYYSNFGYCVLGRVIEKITNTTYENYVKNTILGPAGISTMQIGGNTLAERKPNEVKYYQAEYSPYAMNVSRMDSHGGWIASAKDLAKLMVRIDRNTVKSDIVSSQLLNEMYFGFYNWAHTGSLPGTSSFVARLNDSYSIIFLTNKRVESNTNLIQQEFYDLLIGQISSIENWPTHDLFD